MPIYEYECPGCGSAFEKRVGFSESDEKQVCPQCGNEHARRQLSVIGGISGGSVGTLSVPSCGPVG